MFEVDNRNKAPLGRLERVDKFDTFKGKTSYARILFDSRAFDVAPNFACTAFLPKSYTRDVVAPLFSPNIRLAKSSKMLKHFTAKGNAAER